MTLREQITSDATGVFLDTDEFAESVTYVPNSYFGEAARDDRSIAALVIRNGHETSEDDVTIYSFEVTVANDSTLGISSDEINLGGDKIKIPPRDGKTAQDRTITRIVEQDHAMLVLECR